MTDTLEVRLHGRDAGEIVRFRNGRIEFQFDPGYAARPDRPTLSQSFLDERGWNNAELDKMLGQNWMRVYGKVWGA